MKKLLFACLIIAIVGGGWWALRHHQTKTSSHAPAGQTSKTQSTSPANSFNKQLYSLIDSSSIWVITNKQHPLSPINYAPADLVVPSVPLRVPGNESMQVRAVTATALKTMFAAAAKDNISLMLSSGYRSFAYQTNLYSGYVQTQGQAAADQESARPGYSEHQTGLAADLEPVSKNCELQQCFGSTPEGQWLAAHAYQYGFIIRYAADNQNITGYEPEPWHVRYIGTALATEMHNRGIQTLEQFFNVSGGTTYKSP